MIQQTILPIELCSRCLTQEINSWIEERWQDISESAKKEIREELKTIKLISGECVTCKNTLISKGTSERILSILEEKKVSKEIVEEFKKYFIYVE